MSAAMTSDSPGHEVSAAALREVMSHFATGITIVTARWEEHDYGMAATAIASVTLEPPTVLACLNRSSSTHKAVTSSGSFVISILKEEQADLVGRFASDSDHKFTDVPVVRTQRGEPLLADSLANLECRVTSTHDAGTHEIVLGELERVHIHSGEPLIYYRRRTGRFEDGIRTKTAQSPDRELVRDGTEDADNGVDRLRAKLAIDVGVISLLECNPSGDDLANLRDQAQRSLELVSDRRYVSDVSQYVEAVTGFHEELVWLCRSRSLMTAYRCLGIGSVVLPAITRSDSRREEIALGRMALVDALASGDKDEMQRHVVAQHRRAVGLQRAAVRPPQSRHSVGPTHFRGRG
ncbi:MAG: hypothetical protein GEV10_15265 [Streptosporangiales bacterium]|nr:hypothetical protein [Streptosporangiales bacterium]